MFQSLIHTKNSDPGWLIPEDKEEAEKRSKMRLAQQEENRRLRREARKEGEKSESSEDTPPEDRMGEINICRRCGLER